MAITIHCIQMSQSHCAPVYRGIPLRAAKTVEPIEMPLETETRVDPWEVTGTVH